MNKNSKVLALKYRPKTFKDLIGQEIVAETIYNSIKQNRSANAYLFTGIRGVGKTTIARIVAKALNCKNGIENLCKDNFCENCEAISNSNHIDIFELDAASRSSVENTRELVEFSRYAPTSSTYKIYILDLFKNKELIAYVFKCIKIVIKFFNKRLTWSNVLYSLVR